MQLILVAFIAGTAAALAAHWLAGRFARGHANVELNGPLEPVRFLFCRTHLVHATGPARRLLDVTPGESEWSKLTAWLSMRFGGDGASILTDVTSPRSCTAADGASLMIEDLGDNYIRMTLRDPRHSDGGLIVEPLSQHALEAEVELVRRALDNTPMLAWCQNENDEIVWANAAYLALVEQNAPDRTMWPLPKIIDDDSSKDLPSGEPFRARMNDTAGEHWYDCTRNVGEQQTIYCALPADQTVRAERSLREFVQTLTKTFADLPIGLAIFDRERRLQLFNPSLIDLTGLSTGFLTARPTLYAVLDRLRDAKMVPEPKDYRGWQHQMTNLEAAAASGYHVETWSLPGGMTYRVTGRPHPNGAIAFLFEDITSEVAVTRRFRSKMALSNQLIDGLDDAVAIVGAGHQVELSNIAWRSLWGGSEPTSSAQNWTDELDRSDESGDLKNALSRSESLSRNVGLIVLASGQSKRWSVSGIGGGRRLVTFSDRCERFELRAESPAVVSTVSGQRSA